MSKPDIDITGWMRKHWFDVLYCIVVFGIAIYLGLAATVSGSGINPDAINYISMSTNIYRGLGFVSDMVGPFSLESVTPVTYWPPGYSLLVSVLMLFGPTAVEAARLVPILSFGLATFAVYLLGYTLGGRLVAVIAATTTLVCTPILRLATFALSDMTFVWFSVFAVLGMVYFTRSNTHRSSYWLVFAAICIALAIFTRYVGITWIPVGILAILYKTRLQPRRWTTTFVQLAGFNLISILPVGFWFLRNLRITGQVSGMDRSTGYHPNLSENLVFLAKTLINDLTPSFHFGLRSIARELNGVHWLLIIALTLATLIVLLLRARAGVKRVLTLSKSPGERARLQNLLFSSLIVFLCVVLYTVLILFLSSTIQFAPYDWPRYMAVMYPLILVLLAAAWVQGARLIGGHWPAWLWTPVIVLLPLLWVLPYGVQTIGFVSVAAQGQGYSTGQWRANHGITYLAQVLTEKDTIYSDQPAAVNYVLGRPTRFLPYSNEMEQFAAFLQAKSKEDNSTYIILFKGELAAANPYAVPRLSAADIATLAQENPYLQLIADYEDSTIYQLNPVSQQTALPLASEQGEETSHKGN